MQANTPCQGMRLLMKRKCFLSSSLLPFKHQPLKMVKHTKTIRRQQPTNADELFECVWPFCGVGA